MRRGCKPQIVKDNANLIGFFTDSDACSEHEWGIKDLRRLLGCSEARPTDAEFTDFGIKSRMINPACYKKNSFFHKTDSWAVLIVQPEWLLRDRDYRNQKNWPMFLDKPCKERPISAAWSGSDLGLAVHKEHINALERIHNACLEGHGALVASGALNPFDNGGLVLCDARMIAKNDLLKMDEADRQTFKLYSLHRSIGIEERLLAHNRTVAERTGLDPWRSGERSPFCRWIALSPKWNNGSMKTAHPIIYWLNPMDQKNCTFGWVTVEQLEGWMKGEVGANCVRLR